MAVKTEMREGRMVRTEIIVGGDVYAALSPNTGWQPDVTPPHAAAVGSANLPWGA